MSANTAELQKSGKAARPSVLNIERDAGFAESQIWCENEYNRLQNLLGEDLHDWVVLRDEWSELVGKRSSCASRWPQRASAATRSCRSASALLRSFGGPLPSVSAPIFARKEFKLQNTYFSTLFKIGRVIYHLLFNIY